MSNAEQVRASCLCNMVSLEIASMSLNVGACHCDMCRKWGGGPLLAVDCETDVVIHGQEYAGSFSSSQWAERGFCRNCGTHLFYKLKESGQYIVPVGLIDEEVSFNFDHQIFIDKKPPYYDFANQTENMTSDEVFAKYSGN